jgi:hypothetical protein
LTRTYDRPSHRTRLLLLALACSLALPPAVSLAATTTTTTTSVATKKSAKVVKKKHRRTRHSGRYGFLPGYVPPGDDEIDHSPTARRHTVYSYSYGGGYWYPAGYWWGYGGPRFYRGRWNGGAFGPCWTSTPIGPMWNCGR